MEKIGGKSSGPNKKTSHEREKSEGTERIPTDEQQSRYHASRAKAGRGIVRYQGEGGADGSGKSKGRKQNRRVVDIEVTVPLNLVFTQILVLRSSCGRYSAPVMSNFPYLFSLPRSKSVL